MSPLSTRRRPDPRWQEEGPAARREYRRRRTREMMAFSTSLIAVAAAGAVLALRLGITLFSHG